MDSVLIDFERQETKQRRREIAKTSLDNIIDPLLLDMTDAIEKHIHKIKYYSRVHEEYNFDEYISTRIKEDLGGLGC